MFDFAAFRCYYALTFSFFLFFFFFFLQGWWAEWGGGGIDLYFIFSKVSADNKQVSLNVTLFWFIERMYQAHRIQQARGQLVHLIITINSINNKWL